MASPWIYLYRGQTLELTAERSHDLTTISIRKTNDHHQHWQTNFILMYEK
jgi:hypothetical protein